MNVLIVGKKATFETMVVAYGYLKGQLSDETMEHIGSLSLERQGEPIFIGRDEYGDDIYSYGNGSPHLLALIQQELFRIDDWQAQPMVVVPIAYHTEWLTAAYVMLANLPLIGGIFLGLSRRLTLSNHPALLTIGPADY